MLEHDACSAWCCGVVQSCRAEPEVVMCLIKPFHEHPSCKEGILSGKSTVCKGLVETLTYRMPLRVKLRVATSNAGPV